jgi:protein TonB
MKHLLLILCLVCCLGFESHASDPRPTPLAGNPKPGYPRLAIHRRIEGRVELLVTITSTGHVESVTVNKSSGSQLLDQAAVTTVRVWQYKPTIRNGVAVATTDIVLVLFRINND